VNIKPIKSVQDYKSALQEVEKLMMAAKPNTPEGEKIGCYGGIN